MTESQTATAEEPTPKILGLARWVQLAFVAFAVLTLWVFDKIITIVWDKFAEPQPLVVTLCAASIAAVLTLVAYRHQTVNRVAHEIVGELAKVAWPSRDEVRAATVVVIVTSVIASAIVGAYDAAWSWLTDFIYKV